MMVFRDMMAGVGLFRLYYELYLAPITNSENLAKAQICIANKVREEGSLGGAIYHFAALRSLIFHWLWLALDITLDIGSLIVSYTPHTPVIPPKWVLKLLVFPASFQNWFSHRFIYLSDIIQSICNIWLYKGSLGTVFLSMWSFWRNCNDHDQIKWSCLLISGNDSAQFNE